MRDIVKLTKNKYYGWKKKKKKKTVLIIFLFLGGVVLMGGIFWIGKKIGENKPQPPLSNQTPEQRIATIQNQLATVKKQLAKETNSDQKTKLETKIKQLEQEVVNLKNQQNPTPPTPPNNPPSPPIPPNNPVPPNDLISTICRWNGSVKSGYWLFDNRGQKYKFHISKNHPFLKGKKLDSSDETPPFSIRFNKKNASRQEEDKIFYFDEDNSNFELNPFGGWQDDPQPNNNKKQERVLFISSNEPSGYVFTNRLRNGRRGGESNASFYVSKNHPRIKELLREGKLREEGEEFIIRYGKIDEVWARDIWFHFNEFNTELEIIEV